MTLKLVSLLVGSVTVLIMIISFQKVSNADGEAGRKGEGHRHTIVTQLWAAQAHVRDTEGEEVGNAQLVETPNGVLIIATLQGLSPGAHALHIHETGECEPPFKSAGGHFNPSGKTHGFSSPHGWHAGDLPNVYADAQGSVQVEIFAPQLSLQGGEHPLLDRDGAAFIIHDHADDQRSDPAGDAGDRIACGVIENKTALRGRKPADGISGGLSVAPLLP
jgi:Cu-Zn family superoxide dismutase